MFEGLTWLWTILIGGLAGFLVDLYGRGAKKGVFAGLFAGMVGGFLGGLVLELLNWPADLLAMVILVSVIGVYRGIAK